MCQFVFSGAANHIDFSTDDTFQFSIGFGNAVRYMAQQFQSSGLDFIKGSDALGHKNSNKMVNLAFCYPNEFDFLQEQYKIGYMPWESTGMKKEWVDSLKMCDEVWTTSDWSQKALESLLDKEVFVYEHGIPKFCVPRRRRRGDVLRFLHIGEPALRKNAQDVVDAFVELFGNDKRYQLVLKASGPNTTRIRNSEGESLGHPSAHYSNIVVIEDYLPENMLLDLYNKCDVFVYPSYGEGFGFNAAYAIATGMPTICTSEWAPYRNYISHPLDSKYVESPWPAYHAGNMLEPDIDQMKKHMIELADNYDKVLDQCWINAVGIHERFDWQRVSKKPNSRIKKIISMTSKH